MCAYKVIEQVLYLWIKLNINKVKFTQKISSFELLMDMIKSSPEEKKTKIPFFSQLNLCYDCTDYRLQWAMFFQITFHHSLSVSTLTAKSAFITYIYYADIEYLNYFFPSIIWTTISLGHLNWLQFDVHWFRCRFLSVQNMKWSINILSLAPTQVFEIHYNFHLDLIPHFHSVLHFAYLSPFQPPYFSQHLCHQQIWLAKCCLSIIVLTFVYLSFRKAFQINTNEMEFEQNFDGLMAKRPTPTSHLDWQRTWNNCSFKDLPTKPKDFENSALLIHDQSKLNNISSYGFLKFTKT